MSPSEREASLPSATCSIWSSPSRACTRSSGCFNGPMHKWLLWDQQWMVRQLYALREAGLLSKVSEIDRMRQFTTKYTLDDAVRHLVALAEETPR